MKEQSLKMIINQGILILASASPRRKFLLEQIGVEFIQRAVNAEENLDHNLSPQDNAVKIAETKAEAAMSLIQDEETILSADTIVVFKGKILGKPKDIDEARNFLKKLSNATHFVITGVCLRSKRKAVSFHVETAVTLERMTDEEIIHYTTNWPVLDKAGAYGIQDWLGWAKITSIQGSYSNVMGLPTAQVYDAIQSF